MYTWYGSDGVAEQRRGGGREQRGIIKIHSVIYTSLCEVERKKCGIFFQHGHIITCFSGHFKAILSARCRVFVSLIAVHSNAAVPLFS